MPRTLVVTNDFPTRQGGIEAFVAALCDRFPPDEVVVYTASMPGDAAYDAALPYPVLRDRASTLLPTPRVRRAVVAALHEHGCDRVLFGASAPLGLLAPALREAGARRVVAITHGHEVWWARVPGTRQALRRIGDSVDALTYISGWCRDQIARALSPRGRAHQQRLAPGVDSERFTPGCGGGRVRAERGIGDAPLVVCAARLVPRKGQDTLIAAWPAVLRAVPDARLLVVGDGPYRERLDQQVAKLGLGASVTFTGPVPWAEIPPYFDAADVFAMPSRTRLLGLEPEGLGIVYLEAASCGKPVVVGRSGGAPDAVVDGVTGYLVDPRSPADVAARLVELLTDRETARRMGEAGRERARADWQWDAVARTCRGYLGYPEA
ncbi:glycosyltransferase family 4 protein [Cellulomonas sp. DKR-3]|uniref:D-inositol 3-phosphate glycosyltransferase n=1 Tax=Cellulomonas fulva TaxID=2835530 RepID=A0ABS5TU96_9CELL|nr:glycosyltransferase family 4 protein [Cellulomonas fulva]MBT0992710.1 glycosyltransferase family 4 protein [Cellulomonas fulva]